MKILLLISILCTSLFAAEENFILIDGTTSESVRELGPHIDEQITPCSTFKIALSLIGYDVGILDDGEGPQDWIKFSQVWYSNILVGHLGEEVLQNYLELFDYGNQDISEKLESVWINSSLKISPREQVEFIQKMLLGELPVSSYALQMTKELLFKEELPTGWKLFGKTGLGNTAEDEESGWFVGWVEKEGRFFPFAYNIRALKIQCDQRVPKVKQLIGLEEWE